jgi:pimeloyl-ACP methyl ester carboxylesterase
LWRDFPEALSAATDRDMFLWSRRGFGGSDPAAGPRDRHYLHHDALVELPQVLAAVGIERPILFGHSDGATIALLFAAAHPLDVAGLVLEAPHVFVEPITLAGIEAAVEAWGATDLPAKLARHHRDAATVFAAWRDIWLDPAFRDWNVEAGLETVACPTLIIQGDDDQYGTAAQHRAIVARVTGAHVVELADCGHSPHRDRPAAVLAATVRFLARVEG